MSIWTIRVVGKDQRKMTEIDLTANSNVGLVANRRRRVPDVSQPPCVYQKLLVVIIICIIGPVSSDRGPRPAVDGSSGRSFADSIERLSHEASREDRARLAVAMAMAMRMAESPELEYLDGLDLRCYSGLGLEEFLGRVWANRLLAVSALQHMKDGNAYAREGSKLGKASEERADSLLGFLDNPSCLRVVRNDLR